MAKDQRSFDSALASTLEELDLDFSLKVEQKKARYLFQRMPYFLFADFALIGLSVVLLREGQLLIPLQD